MKARHREIASVVLLWLSVPMASCRPASITELPGRYTAKDDWGEVVLELRQDGGFVELAQRNNGLIKRIEGRWTYRGTRLELLPCLQISHEGVGETPYEACSYSVNRYGLGHVEISLDPDFGLAYRK